MGTAPVEAHEGKISFHQQSLVLQQVNNLRGVFIYWSSFSTLAVVKLTCLGHQEAAGLGVQFNLGKSACAVI